MEVSCFQGVPPVIILIFDKGIVPFTRAIQILLGTPMLRKPHMVSTLFGSLNLQD